MTVEQELLKLAQRVGSVTVAHENVLASSSGTHEKVEMIARRAEALDALEQFANETGEDVVADQAFDAHDALARVVSNSAISDILGAADVLGGFAEAFSGAAEGAEKVQILTDRWSSIAEAAAADVSAVAEDTRQAISAVRDQVKAIQERLTS